MAKYMITLNSDKEYIIYRTDSDCFINVYSTKDRDDAFKKLDKLKNNKE